MSRIVVRVAAGPYAHLAALASQPVRDPSLEIHYEAHHPSGVFRRMLENEAWDVAEMPLATVYLLADRSDHRFIALPVFPSRCFRHSALYVPANSGVTDPRELAGTRIGVLRYAMTTAVWVRALLADSYGVTAAQMEWWVGEPSPHPAAVRPRLVDGAAALEALASRGELECLISGKTPAALSQGNLRRLFVDFASAEKAYYATSRIFPIMHTMVARRQLLNGYAGLLPNLLDCFEAAKRAAETVLVSTDISTYPLPWLAGYVEDARAALGDDLWPYGIEKNRHTLATFGRAMATQGLTQRALAPEDVFVAG